MKALICILILFSLGCSVTSKIKKHQEFSNIVVNGMSDKFLETDTLFFSSEFYRCGRMSRREYNAMFIPIVNDTHFISLLSKKYPQVQYYYKDSIKQIVDSNCNWLNPTGNCFLDDKVKIRIVGRAINRRYVKLIEHYEKDSTYYSRNKSFRLRKGEWILSDFSEKKRPKKRQNN